MDGQAGDGPVPPQIIPLDDQDGDEDIPNANELIPEEATTELVQQDKVEVDPRSDEELATELVQSVLSSLADQKSKTTDVDQLSIHDGYMMCFSNFYTLAEMINHMTSRVGILKSDVVRCFRGLTHDKDSGLAYVKHSYERAKIRERVAAEQALVLRKTQEATPSTNKPTRKKK